MKHYDFRIEATMSETGTPTSTTLGECGGDTPKQALLCALADTYGRYPDRLAARPRATWGTRHRDENRYEVLVRALTTSTDGGWSNWTTTDELLPQYEKLAEHATYWVMTANGCQLRIGVWPTRSPAARPGLTAIQLTTHERRTIVNLVRISVLGTYHPGLMLIAPRGIDALKDSLYVDERLHVLQAIDPLAAAQLVDEVTQTLLADPRVGQLLRE